MSSRALADQVAQVSPPFDRATLKKIEDGDETVRELNIVKVERWLDSFDTETTTELDEVSAATAAPELFEVTVTIGALDLAVTAKGRPEDADLVREQVTKAVAEIMRGAQSD